MKRIILLAFIVCFICIGCNSAGTITGTEKSNVRTAVLYNNMIEGEGVITPSILREDASGGGSGLLLDNTSQFVAYFKIETTGLYTLEVTYCNCRASDSTESITIDINGNYSEKIRADETGSGIAYRTVQSENPLFLEAQSINIMSIAYSGGDGLEVDYIVLNKID